MDSADNFVSRFFQTALVGGSMNLLFRNCGVILGIAILGFTLLTVLFIFVQEGMLF